MSSSFQNEIPKARVNLKLDLHTGGGQKKVELPLKLLVAGDFSNGQEERPLSERVKTDINKNNFNDVLADIFPSVHLNVENTLAGDGSEESISLTFRNMNDFTPEQVARQIRQLKLLPEDSPQRQQQIQQAEQHLRAQVYMLAQEKHCE